MKQPQERAKLSAEQWESLAADMVRHGAPMARIKTARRCVEAGIRLLILKEITPHGEFKDRVNGLGLGERSARNCMASARRFMDAPDAFFDAIGSAGKLLELLPLDDADALAQGHAVHGLTLDLVAQMTVKELRVAVRAAVAAAYKPVLQDVHEAARKLERALPVQSFPAVRITVEEERMLRRYRKCNAEGRAALLQVAGLLECGATS